MRYDRIAITFGLFVLCTTVSYSIGVYNASREIDKWYNLFERRGVIAAEVDDESWVGFRVAADGILWVEINDEGYCQRWRWLDENARLREDWSPHPVLTQQDGRIIVDEVVSVYDGDTFRVNIHHWPSIVGEEISIRVRGIDSPEMRGVDDDMKELALAARDVVDDALRRANTIELYNLERGKYFRIIADVSVDGDDLANMLLDRGLAKSYDGEGPRPTWTTHDYEEHFNEPVSDESSN